DESFDHILRTPKDSEDDGNSEEDQGLRINEEERIHEKEEVDELYRDVNINQGRGLQVSHDVEDSHVTLTPVHPDGQQESSSVSSFVTSMLNPISDEGVESIFTTASSSVAPLPTPIPTMTPSIITTITTASHPPIPPTPISSEVLQNLPTFDSVFRFNERLKSLEASFSEYRQTNPFAEAVSNISGIVLQYINQQMHEAVRVAVQIQTDRLHDSYQRENDEFLKTLDENMKRIIKEQVKSQIKDQVSRILPRIEQFVNAQLESKVLTRSSHSSRTSYAVAADLSEMELKKILIEKMEGNKETAILKRRCKDEDDDDQEGPSAGSDRESKRRREGGEPESAYALLEPATRSAGRVDTLTPELLAGPTYELMRGSCNSLTELEYHLEEVYKEMMDQLDWVNPEGQQYLQNLLQPLSLIPNTQGHRVIPFAHFINNDLEYLREEPINYDRHALWGVSHWGRKCQQFYGFAVNREYALDVYSKRRIIAVIDLKIVEWHNWKLYNLIVEERFAFNVFLRMFTRSIVIQRHVKDLQLGVESYQKRLNLTKPDTYRSDLKQREAYTTYSNLKGFIYQNKDKKNGLMWIDKLYKFSDGTLNDVRNALDDRLKGIRMQYFPTTISRRGDKDRAASMIQAIDKMLKTRRIMRSLEKFIVLAPSQSALFLTSHFSPFIIPKDFYTNLVDIPG
nr:hypothetical protein [Tanacetum cinerariifolium]